MTKPGFVSAKAFEGHCNVAASALDSSCAPTSPVLVLYVTAFYLRRLWNLMCFVPVASQGQARLMWMAAC